MIARLATAAALQEGARNVDHVRSTTTLIEQRTAAAPAKAARRDQFIVVKAHDVPGSLGYAPVLSPTPDIRRIDRSVREPACATMIVPGPEGGKGDFKGN